MEEIIADAQALGKKIAGHPRVADFLAAARAVAEDRSAQETLKAYQDQAHKIQTLEASRKPIEVEDKRRLSDCQAKVAGNDKIKRMMKTQADYVELMERVQNAMEEAIQLQHDGADAADRGPGVRV